MKILRIIVVLLALALVAYGLTRESHDVMPREGGFKQSIDGYGFNNGATSDRYMLRDGKLFDTRGKSQPESATLDDCPT